MFRANGAQKWWERERGGFACTLEHQQQAAHVNIKVFPPISPSSSSPPSVLYHLTHLLSAYLKKSTRRRMGCYTGAVMDLGIDML